MTNDQSEAQGRGYAPPPAARNAAKTLAVLAGLGLVVVIFVAIDLVVRQHGYSATDRHDRAAAQAQAEAKAQTFYRHLLAAADTTPLSADEVRALSRQDRVLAQTPESRGDVVVVAFRSGVTYAKPGFLAGTDEQVERCYSAMVPLPHARASAGLKEITCPTSQPQ